MFERSVSKIFSFFRKPCNHLFDIVFCSRMTFASNGPTTLICIKCKLISIRQYNLTDARLGPKIDYMFDIKE